MLPKFFKETSQRMEQSRNKKKLKNVDGEHNNGYAASEVPCKLLDTSVIIDGRIADICRTGFIDGKLLIPVFVLEELQHIADMSDSLKRVRGRRGLDILQQLQSEFSSQVEIVNQDFDDIAEVDSKLVKLGQITGGKIITNDYNLNIPRYVDSSEAPEKWDIYSTMFGGIPAEELAEFDHYFALFPGLKEHLFSKTNEKYFEVASQNIHDDVITHESVKAYQTKFAQTFSSFYQVLKTNLIDQYETINISSTEQQLGNQLFDLLNEIKLIDNYDAYQILSDTWNSISQNLEILKAEGLDACRKIDENTVYKKDDKSKELIPVQDGYKGRIFDFEIVKQYQLQTEVAEIQQKNDELNEIASQYEELFSNLTEDQQEGL